MTDALESWIARQYRAAAADMLHSVSPIGLVKTRPFLGQTVRPKKGAIIASPVVAAYDPDPDYFFHWFRDSAIVVDALRLLWIDGVLGAEAVAHFGDFVRFSLALDRIDGRALIAAPAWRDKVADESKKFIRADDEFAAVHGAAVGAEARINPDGTLDVQRWARPQHDGPALRALAILRWTRDGETAFDARLAADAARLLGADLAFTLDRWRAPSFDIWEEESGQHYYTLRVQEAALRAGADWLAGRDQSQAAACSAEACRAAADELTHRLDDYWREDERFYRSRFASGADRSKELDISVILAALHVDAETATHSVRDPKMAATLTRLERLFAEDYAINHDPARRAPAMGRYAGDVYYSGGAYYFSTLAAAEFCYRAAAAQARSASDPAERRRSGLARGDAFLETVRAFAPASGELSEQFDRTTGAPTSAKRLAWSYAAFISCVAARRACLARDDGA